MLLLSIAIVAVVSCAQGRHLASYIGPHRSGQLDCQNPDAAEGCSFQCRVAFHADTEYQLCKNYEDRGTCLKEERCVSRFDQIKKGKKPFYGACCCNEEEHPYLHYILTSGDFSVYIDPIVDKTVLKGQRQYCNITVCKRPYLAGSLTHTGPAICCNAESDENAAGTWLNNGSQCCGSVVPPSHPVTNPETCCTTQLGSRCGWLGTPWTWPWERLETCCMETPDSEACYPECRFISYLSIAWLSIVLFGVWATYKKWARVAGSTCFEHMQHVLWYLAVLLLFFVSSLLLDSPAWHLALPGLLMVLALAPLTFWLMRWKSPRPENRSSLALSAAVYESLAGQDSKAYCFAKIISNQEYKHLRDVKDTYVDKIAAKLASLGWAGAEHVKRNLTAREMRNEIEEVLQFIRGCSAEDRRPITVLLWFSGHGLTLFGTEFLLGVDASHRCLGVQWLEIQRMLDVRGPEGRPVRVLAFLSACRSPAYGTAPNAIQLQYARYLCRWRCYLHWFQRIARPSDPGSLVAWACSEGREASPGVMSQVFAEQLQGGEHNLRKILDEVRVKAPELCIQRFAEPQALDIQDNLRAPDFCFDVGCGARAT